MSGRSVTNWIVGCGLAICVVACSNSAKKGVGNGTDKATTDAAVSTGGIAPACLKLKAQVTSLYKQAEPPDKNAKKQKRREMVMADNVTMVLTDCTKNPTRFVPCIKQAKNVGALERNCLVKLDDEGRVEGDHFQNNP